MRDLANNRMLDHKREDSKVIGPMDCTRNSKNVRTPSVGGSSQVSRRSSLLLVSGPEMQQSSILMIGGGRLNEEAKDGYFSFQHTGSLLLLEGLPKDEFDFSLTKMMMAYDAEKSPSLEMPEENAFNRV